MHVAECSAPRRLTLTEASDSFPGRAPTAWIQSGGIPPMNFFKQYTPKDGYTALVKPGKDGIELIELGILQLPPGGKCRGSTDGGEVCLVLLGGLANVTAGEADFHSIGGRANVFAGRATAIHVPPGLKFKIQAIPPFHAS